MIEGTVNKHYEAIIRLTLRGDAGRDLYGFSTRRRMHQARDHTFVSYTTEQSALWD